MRLIEANEQVIWDDFVSGLPYAQFTQSWIWGELQRSLGREPKRFFIHDEAEAVGAVQLMYQRRPLVGGYWLAPRGPVMLASLMTEESLKNSMTLLADATLPNSVFFRFEPLLSTKHQNLMPKAFQRQRSYNPSTTALLDLTLPEEDLLAAMHPKTRYNIKVAEKHGVAVREDKNIDTFLSLQKDTAARDEFMPQSDEYVRKQFDFLSEHGMAKILVAEKDGEALAANFMITYGDTCTYLYGASSSNMRNMMAPFALHWEAIRWAKASGFSVYDFWGCNPEDSNAVDFKPRWEGITRFKIGWGSDRISFVGTYDVPKKPGIYKLLKMLGRV